MSLSCLQGRHDLPLASQSFYPCLNCPSQKRASLGSFRPEQNAVSFKQVRSESILYLQYQDLIAHSFCASPSGRLWGRILMFIRDFTSEEPDVLIRDIDLHSVSQQSPRMDHLCCGQKEVPTSKTISSSRSGTSMRSRPLSTRPPALSRNTISSERGR